MPRAFLDSNILRHLLGGPPQHSPWATWNGWRAASCRRASRSWWSPKSSSPRNAPASTPKDQIHQALLPLLERPGIVLPGATLPHRLRPHRCRGDGTRTGRSSLTGGLERVLARAATLGRAKGDHLERPDALPLVQEHPAAATGTADTAFGRESGAISIGGGAEVLKRHRADCRRLPPQWRGDGAAGRATSQRAGRAAAVRVP